MFITKSYRKDHPNPMLFRENYEILNGTWDFAFDMKNKGERLQYYKNFPKDLKINVPFCYLTKNSGINVQDRCDNVWYETTINVDSLDKKTILHFEGSDYTTKVWVNSLYIGEDKGAYHRLSFDITRYLVQGENKITVKCEDDFSLKKPRGKQRFLKKNFLCWYEETTGIYKTVWIEKVNEAYIKDVRISPIYYDKTVLFSFELSQVVDYINVTISYKDKVLSEETVEVNGTNPLLKVLISSEDFHSWDVLNPELYDVTISTIKNENETDKILSYFGFREIHTEGYVVKLNGKPLYQKLVLDQGYFDGGDLTPSSEGDLLNDITNMIDMGFNGARKHQKREDDRFYYFADALGYLVWAEMPSMYRLTNESKNVFANEWMKIVHELYNHPSIIVWTPFNESWGIFNINKNLDTQSFVNKVVEGTKNYDDTRLVISNDGWTHTQSDLVTIHSYHQDATKLSTTLVDAKEKMKIPTTNGYKSVFAKGYSYYGEPLLLTEFGGTAYKDSELKNWGYGKAVKTNDEYVERLKSLFKAIKDNKDYVGYCYTQVSDVKQEINGLYTMDRKAKIDPKVLKGIQEE